MVLPLASREEESEGTQRSSIPKGGEEGGRSHWCLPSWHAVNMLSMLICLLQYMDLYLKQAAMHAWRVWRCAHTWMFRCMKARSHFKQKTKEKHFATQSLHLKPILLNSLLTIYFFSFCKYLIGCMQLGN